MIRANDIPMISEVFHGRKADGNMILCPQWNQSGLKNLLVLPEHVHSMLSRVPKLGIIMYEGTLTA